MVWAILIGGLLGFVMHRAQIEYRRWRWNRWVAKRNAAYDDWNARRKAMVEAKFPNARAIIYEGTTDSFRVWCDGAMTRDDAWMPEPKLPPEPLRY